MKTAPLLIWLLACPGIMAQELKLVTTVTLPGVKGRFDHFAVDTKAMRLFAAALGNNTLEVIDAEGMKRKGAIPGLRKPTGVAFLPKDNQIVVANGDDGTVKVFNGTDYKLIKNIRDLDDADNVRIDPVAHRIYVGYGDGALAIIDANKLEIVGAIKLKGHPESFQLEQNGPLIFVNVPDAKHVAVVDRNKRAVAATWATDLFHANFAMALDEPGHRLIVGCRQPARAVVMDTRTDRVMEDFAISGDTDDLFWDAVRKKLYVSCGEGFLDVFADRDERFRRTEHVATRPGARTSFFDDASGHFYLAIPERGGAPAELRMFTAK
jgi:DNA-binding beta-propeller fold protein YncE